MSKTNARYLAVVFVFSSLLHIGHAQALLPSHSSSLMRTATVNREMLNACTSGAANLPIECYEPGTHLQVELLGLGVQGDLISQVREQTLQILNSENRCSAWFAEVEPHAAEVFRSLHYDIDKTGTADIHSSRDAFGDLYFMFPWGAKSIEYSGRDAFIQLNGNGPFFASKTHVAPELDLHIGTPQHMYIGPFQGASTEARLAIMLHELGHIVGRLPQDDLSWDGRSSDNTREVLRHCKKDIREIARQTR